MPSREYNSLSARLGKLKVQFIPEYREFGDEYTLAEQDYTRAYVLLCSAEIEHFIERLIAKLTAKSASKLKSGKIPVSAASMIMHDQLDRTNINKKNILTVCNECLSRLNRKLNSNNGYKQQTVEKLFKSLGFERIDEHNTLLSTLDGFGRVRGAVAHTTSGAEENVVDPKSAVDDVVQIVGQLELLDAQVSEYARRI